MKQMPQYQAHKKVWAVKIKEIAFNETDGTATVVPEDAGFAPFEVSAEYCQKHKPQTGGYFVQYEDGYKSWSPAKAFEEGYTKI